MKNIQISDKDYEVLMKLSKELQTQENDGQAFPRFWEPSSTRMKQNPNGDGEIVRVYMQDECYTIDPESLIEHDDKLWNSFLDSNGYNEHVKYEKIETEWIDFIEKQYNYSIYTLDEVRIQEHNPSLFKSDVHNFCEFNKHHLGKNPGTYARTVWRMPKMIKLINIITRLNK